MNKKIIIQLMDSILAVENYPEILPVLFEKYILEGDTPLDLQNFNEQFSYTFNTSPFLWQEVFSNNLFLKFEELEVNPTHYKSVYKLITKMKSLYAVKFMKLLLHSRDPFMLVNTNIITKHNDTTHTITFFRGDSNSMSFNFNAESLIVSMIAMQQSLNDSFKTGLFVLSEHTLNTYLETNRKLNETLQQISNAPELQVKTSDKDFN